MKKKWKLLILLAVVVAIVLVIVFIDLFTPKNTTALAKDLNSYVESGYLNENDEKMDKIDSYLLSVYSSTTSSEERDSTLNYTYAFSAYSDIGGFFNRHLLFSSHSSVYKTHRKPIAKALKKAQSAVDSLNSYIVTNEEKWGDNNSWILNSWTDTQGYVETIVKNTNNAFSRLAKVFSSCVNSVYYNNEFSSIIFTELDNFYDKFTKEASTTGIGVDFQTFVSAYLVKDSTYVKGEALLVKYYLDTTEDGIKFKVSDILEKGENSAYYNSFVGGGLS